MKMNFKTVIAAIAAAAALVGCAEGVSTDLQCGVEGDADGMMSVRMIYDDVMTKAETEEYEQALDDEKIVRKVSVLVFDKATGRLNAFKEISSLSQECKVTIPVGEKTVFAVVNGPDLSAVTKLEHFYALSDNLAENDYRSDRFTLVGTTDCTVEAGKTVEPTVAVKWLVARVVLNKVTCNLAPQYGDLTVNCVYLGNANTIQKFSGEVSVMANPDGYVDSSKSVAVGKGGEIGTCPDYMYRTVGYTIPVGGNITNQYYMYCQPNASTTYTCMYVVATIAGERNYYRVPLKNSLKANHTYSVDLTIANLGSPVPPVGDYQTGAVRAVISIGSWTVGNSYTAEF